MNNIPLSDASFSEVLARVAFRLIHLYAGASVNDTQSPPERMLMVQRWLHGAGFEALSAFVYRYAVDWAPAYFTIDIRDNLIILARQGQSWRRVAYPAYKKARRDPRVTNRGVTSQSPSGEK